MPIENRSTQRATFRSRTVVTSCINPACGKPVGEGYFYCYTCNVAGFRLSREAFTKRLREIQNRDRKPVDTIVTYAHTIISDPMGRRLKTPRLVEASRRVVYEPESHFSFEQNFTDADTVTDRDRYDESDKRDGNIEAPERTRKPLAIIRKRDIGEHDEAAYAASLSRVARAALPRFDDDGNPVKPEKLPSAYELSREEYLAQRKVSRSGVVVLSAQMQIRAPATPTHRDFSQLLYGGYDTAAEFDSKVLRYADGITALRSRPHADWRTVSSITDEFFAEPKRNSEWMKANKNALSPAKRKLAYERLSAQWETAKAAASAEWAKYRTLRNRISKGYDMLRDAFEAASKPAQLRQLSEWTVDAETASHPEVAPFATSLPTLRAEPLKTVEYKLSLDLAGVYNTPLGAISNAVDPQYLIGNQEIHPDPERSFAMWKMSALPKELAALEARRAHAEALVEIWS